MEVDCVYLDTCEDRDKQCGACQNNKNLRLYISLTPEEAKALNKHSELMAELISIEKTIKVNTSSSRIEELTNRLKQVRREIYGEEALKWPVQ